MLRVINEGANGQTRVFKGLQGGALISDAEDGVYRSVGKRIKAARSHRNGQ